MMNGNIADEYYYREENVVLMIRGDADKIKQQILENQEKLEKIKEGLTNGMYDQQAHRYIREILNT